MGGGDLNTKKSWHPNTMKNQEKVWKAEKAAAEEKKKVLELQMEYSREKDRHELNAMAKHLSGDKSDDGRLHWMYNKPDKEASQEDYLLGKSIDKNFDKNDKPEEHIPAVARRVVGSSMLNVTDDTQVDLVRKMREDPLLLIKEKERAARAALLNNPLQRRRLTELLRKEQEQKEIHKKNKKSKKNSKDLNSILAAKLNALGDKKLDVAALLASDSDSSSSSSHHKKHKKKKKKSKSSKKEKSKKIKKCNDSDYDSSENEAKPHKSDRKERLESTKKTSKPKYKSTYYSDDEKHKRSKEELSEKVYCSKKPDSSNDKQDRVLKRKSTTDEDYLTSSNSKETKSNKKSKYDKKLKMPSIKSSVEKECKDSDGSRDRFNDSSKVSRRVEKSFKYSSEHSKNRSPLREEQRAAKKYRYDIELNKPSVKSSVEKERNDSKGGKDRFNDSSKVLPRIEKSFKYSSEQSTKRSALSEEERAAKLAEMSSAGAERERDRQRRVAEQRKEAMKETAYRPRSGVAKEAHSLPDSLESRIHSNRHYIQRSSQHMNENFAKR